MLFHVLLERMEAESPDPGQTGPMLEKFVLPTFDRLMQLEKEGKIRGGGLLTGQRAITMMLEAASIEEADSLIESLPLWPFMKVQVTPLTPFAARKKSDQALLEHLKAGVR